MTIQQDVARELSEELVVELAPDEQEMFADLWSESLRPGKKRSSGDDPLSAGVGNIIEFATPHIIHAVGVACTILATEAQTAFTGATKDFFTFLREKLRLRLAIQPGAEPSTPAAVSSEPARNQDPAREQSFFTTERLEKVKKEVKAALKREGTEEALADAIALKIVGKLALAK